MGTFFKDLKVRKQSGFTLVELMVVVAIIGILSAVAIPNFKTYQAKSKTSEAKLQLAALYSAQLATAADYDTYASCLAYIGYDPSNELANRYYSVGVSAYTLPSGVSAQLRNASCVQTSASGTNWFPGGKAGKGAPFTAIPSNVALDQVSFTAAAEGCIRTDGANGNCGAAETSQWTITQNKLLNTPQRGY